MVFHIVTIFPEIFNSYFNEGILKRAQKQGLLEIKIYDIRDYTDDKHRKVDDTPYGGGAGMVMRVEPIARCLDEIKNNLQKDGVENKDIYKVLFSAKGKEYTQTKAKVFKKYRHLIMVCGRYEGVDERVANYWVDEEISIGKYILTGGEIPAMVVVDSISRLVPGVLGNPDSLISESFEGLENEETDYPVYTKPEVFSTYQVPTVLLSGNHKAIELWRKENRRRL